MQSPRGHSTRCATRRMVLRAATFGAGALSVACAGGGQAQTAPAAGQPVKLQLWTFPVTHHSYFKELAPVWKEKSRIEVEATLVASDPNGQSWADKYQVELEQPEQPEQPERPE